jgi:transketolase
MNILDLKCKAIEIRRLLLTMIYHGKTGHTGGALSSADILTALYYEVMKVDPQNPKWEERDRFVLSKGHSVEGYYSILADKGFIEKAELETFSQYGTRLIGHPNNKVPGVEVNTGALGHGLPVSVGMAIGLKKSGSGSRMYVLMGDGEQAEGSVWEAAMAASHYKLDNLTAIIDRNHLQISGSTEDVMALEPLAGRWKSFGWSVKEIDGNDMQAIVGSLKASPFEEGKPSMIIANTIKGKGVKEMENVAKWHHGVPSEALLQSAMEQLNQVEKELKSNG